MVLCCGKSKTVHLKNLQAKNKFTCSWLETTTMECLQYGDCGWKVWFSHDHKLLFVVFTQVRCLKFTRKVFDYFILMQQR